MPPRELMVAMDELMAGAGAALVDTGGLAPFPAGALLAIRSGSMSVTDGPFLESKEVVGGYAVLDVPDQEQAVAWAERVMRLHLEHWPGWEGEMEVRQILANPARPASNEDG